MSSRTIVRILVSISIIITIIGIGIKISIANAQEHPHADTQVNARLHEPAFEPRGQLSVSANPHENHLRELAIHDHQVMHLDVHNTMSVHAV
jgi:hypothetical protein